MTRLAWYTADEASGALLDASGNGNNIALSGVLARTAAGGGYTYGGAAPNSKGITQTSAFAVSAGPPVALVQTGAYTMCAWVKRTSAQDGWILTGQTGGSGDRGVLFLSGAVQSRCKNGAGLAFTASGTEPTLGTWFFIATVCTGTVLRLFMNSGGSAVQIGSDVTVTSGVRTTSTDSNLLVDCGPETVIDGAQYFDAALNAAQLTAIMNTPFAGGTTITLNPATETDTAQTLGRRKSRVLGPATEASTAPSIPRRKTRALGPATELDAALSVARRKARALGTVTETDSGLAVVRRKLKVIGAAGETDTGQQVQRRKQRVTAPAVETDAASVLTGGRRRSLAPAAEQDEAVPVLVRAASVVNPATETDTAPAAGRRRAKAVSPAAEAGGAMPIGRARRRAIGPASESDTAPHLFTVTRRLVGVATEQDAAGSVLIATEHRESVLTATNTPTGVLVASSIPSSRLEASHGV